MDDLSWARRHRCGNTALGEKRDEPTRTLHVLRRDSVPLAAANAPALMASKALHRSLAYAVQLEASVVDPGSKVPSGIRIPPDRQVAVRQSPEAASEL
jgi:hypothetical protein